MGLWPQLFEDFFYLAETGGRSLNFYTKVMCIPTYAECYENIPSKLPVLRKICQNLIDKAIVRNVIPMSDLVNRLP